MDKDHLGYGFKFWQDMQSEAKEVFGISWPEQIKKEYSNFGGFNHFSGYRIYTDVSLVDEHTTKTKRTWRERLFSLPWKPWKRFNVSYTTTPKDSCLMFGNNIVCHPEMFDKLKAVLDQRYGAKNG